MGRSQSCTFLSPQDKNSGTASSRFALFIAYFFKSGAAIFDFRPHFGRSAPYLAIRKIRRFIQRLIYHQFFQCFTVPADPNNTVCFAVLEMPINCTDFNHAKTLVRVNQPKSGDVIK